MLFFELLLNHLKLAKLVEVFFWIKVYFVLLISKLIKVHVVFIILDFVPMAMFIFVMLIHIIEN